MSLTNNVKLAAAQVSADASATELAVVAEAAVVVPLETALDPADALLGDWAFQEAAENRNGEVAVGGHDLDATDGLKYTGPTGAAVRCTFQITGTAQTLGIAPEATDTITLALFQNNDIVAFADEGFVAEIDAGEVVWNVDTYVSLVEGDALHVGAIGGTEETYDYDIDEGGFIQIT